MPDSIRKISLIIIVLFISACSSEKTSENVEKVDDHPTSTAILFFKAVYNTQDMNRAASYSSPQLARIIRHYKSSSAVQRHVIGMQFDKEVAMKEDRDGKAYRETFSNDATVSLKFKGTLRGEKKEDFRTIKMKKYKGVWKVEEVVADKFI